MSPEALPLTKKCVRHMCGRQPRSDELLIAGISASASSTATTSFSSASSSSSASAAVIAGSANDSSSSFSMPHSVSKRSAVPKNGRASKPEPLSEESKALMNVWFEAHRQHPYPRTEDKKLFMQNGMPTCFPMYPHTTF